MRTPDRLAAAQLARRSGQSADRPRRGQPLLEPALRRRPRRDRGRLRHPGRPAQPPGAARLAGPSFRRVGWDIKALLKQVVTSATYRQSSRTTPEKLATDPRNRLYSHAPALPAGSRDRARPGPGAGRPAEPQGRRPQRLPAAARRTLASRLQRSAHLGHLRRRRPLPPRPLHLLAPHRALPFDGRLRRPQPRDLLDPPHPHQHPASGLRHSE